METSFLFKEWIFQVLLFTVQQSSGDSQNFSVFPSGDETSVQFSYEDGISGFFYDRSDSLANFSGAGGKLPTRRAALKGDFSQLVRCKGRKLQNYTKLHCKGRKL